MSKKVVRNFSGLNFNYTYRLSCCNYKFIYPRVQAVGILVKSWSNKNYPLKFPVYRMCSTPSITSNTV